MNPPGRSRGLLFVVLALFAGVPEIASAQARRWEQLYTADGVRLDFAPDGVWRVKARRVAEERARLLSQGRFAELNRGAQARAPQGDFTPPSVSGTLFVPSILIAFKDEPDTTLLSRATRYDSVLYGTDTEGTLYPGRPYSLRNFYEEMSNGLLSVQGQAFGWAVADSNQAYYLEACGSGADPFGCDSGRVRAGRLFRQALSRVDAAVDFRLFDNSGANDIPGDGDAGEDGVVDVVQFIMPVVGKECGGPGYNAHRFFLSPIGGAYTTDDARVGAAGFIQVNSYYVTAGVGASATVCSGDQIMGIGTSAHELGHGIGLPDLYDTDPTDGDDAEGAGEWGLMGSGNYASLFSPAHFDAWSKQQMGWVTVRPLMASGAYNLGPVVSAGPDTVFLIRPTGSNTRGEYFLLENKQAAGSDAFNMQTGRTTGPKVGGLLVWQVDSAKIAAGSFLNEVNTGTIHGLSLVQADNLNHLRLSSGGNRGDAGDPYPGSTNNVRLSYNSAPANTKNADGTFVGFEISSITQVVPNGQMSFQLTFGGTTIVRASDTTAQVSVNGTKYGRFAQLLEVGTMHTVAIDSVQVTTDSLTQYHFDAWSDAGARSHQITASLAGDSISAAVHQRKRVRATTSGGGTITANPAAANLAAGVYVRRDSTVTLKAIPDGGNLFAAWSGDTATTVDSLVLTTSKSYTVAATFASPVVADAGTPPDGVVGATYNHVLTASGGTGSFTWSIVSGSLPNGLSLSAGGAITGTPSQAGDFAAEARATSGPVSDDVTVDISVFVPLVAIIGAPPEPRVGSAYSHTLTATGGTATYSWSVLSGSLPSGLMLSSAGEITGTPTAGGNFAATLRVTSGSQTADVNFNLIAATTLSASGGTPPAGVMGKAYTHQLTATGGTGTYSWAVQSGALPDGLGLAATGGMTGIPTKTGSFNATARVTSGSQTSDVAVAISVTAPTLTLGTVVAHILGTASGLTADELKYLDLLGNNNGGFDVGDFLAWVDFTGATPALLADVQAALPPVQSSAPPSARPTPGARQ